MIEQTIEAVNKVPSVVSTKVPLTYEQQISKMSNKQLKGELRRRNRMNERPLLKGIWTTVLLVVLENHQKGMKAYIR